MPLFKIVDSSRSKKGLIRASSLEEVLIEAKKKFNLPDDTEYKIVEEEDGTEIFDDAVLLERCNQFSDLKTNLTLMVLPTNAAWTEKILILDNIFNQDIVSNQAGNETFPISGTSSSTNDSGESVSRNILADILQKVPQRVIEYCAKNLTPIPTDVMLMNAQIGHYMLQVLKDHSRSRAYSIAAMLVNQYPLLGDHVKGHTIGKGYESLGMRIYNAVNYRKDVNDKKRKGAPDPLFNVEEEEDVFKISRRHDQYGCLEYQAGIPPDDLETLDEKRLWLFNLYNEPSQWNSVEISAALNLTFYSQRKMLNAENRCILQLIMYWPFLGESKYLLEHASRVIYGKDGRSGRTINNIWHENLTSTVPAFKQHFKALCLSSKSKKNKPKNSPDFEYIEEMIIEAENMCKDLQNEIPNAILVFKLLVGYLREDEDLLIKVIDDTSTDADTMNSAPSPYPVVMIRGKSIFDPLAQVSVVLEKKIIIKADDVLEGIKTAFASYYVFGYAYPAGLSKSLEFLQRFIFEINPLAVSDKREKGAKRRLRSFDTQVKNLMATLEGIIKTL